MKKFTKVTLIIAAVFVMLGITLCCVGATVAGGLKNLRTMAQSGALNFGNWHFEDGVYYKGEDLIENVGGLELDVNILSEGEENSRNHYDHDIKQIEMDLDLANVIIKSTEQDGITITMENGFTKHYKEYLEEDTLRVTYDGGTNNYKDAPNITIYVPIDCALEEINIETDLGNVEIWDFTQGIEVLKVVANLGNIEIHNSEIRGNSIVEADMGNAQMLQVICKDVEMHSDMGAVCFKGIVNGNLDLSADMGSAEATISGKETDYNVYLSTDMGQVHHNNGHYSNDTSGNYYCENSGAKGDIRIHSSMGEVKLNFE